VNGRKITAPGAPRNRNFAPDDVSWPAIEDFIVAVRRDIARWRVKYANPRAPLIRHASETFSFSCNCLAYVASISRFPDGRLAEIFISNAKAGSHSDSAAKDGAVICSIALQYGVPLDVIRHALLRDPRGVASSPLGVALDKIAEQGCK
jgi:hypothetical protein